MKIKTFLLAMAIPCALVLFWERATAAVIWDREGYPGAKVQAGTPADPDIHPERSVEADIDPAEAGTTTPIEPPGSGSRFWNVSVAPAPPLELQGGQEARDPYGDLLLRFWIWLEVWAGLS